MFKLDVIDKNFNELLRDTISFSHFILSFFSIGALEILRNLRHYIYILFYFLMRLDEAAYMCMIFLKKYLFLFLKYNLKYLVVLLWCFKPSFFSVFGDLLYFFFLERNATFLRNYNCGHRNGLCEGNRQGGIYLVNPINIVIMRYPVHRLQSWFWFSIAFSIN